MLSHPLFKHHSIPKLDYLYPKPWWSSTTNFIKINSKVINWFVFQMSSIRAKIVYTLHCVPIKAYIELLILVYSYYSWYIILVPLKSLINHDSQKKCIFIIFISITKGIFKSFPFWQIWEKLLEPSLSVLLDVPELNTTFKYIKQVLQILVVYLHVIVF